LVVAVKQVDGVNDINIVVYASTRKPSFVQIAAQFTAKENSR